jgi:hypothetical protein
MNNPNTYEVTSANDYAPKDALEESKRIGVSSSKTSTRLSAAGAAVLNGNTGSKLSGVENLPNKQL